jgi:hypothetical protein
VRQSAFTAYVMSPLKLRPVALRSSPFHRGVGGVSGRAVLDRGDTKPLSSKVELNHLVEAGESGGEVPLKERKLLS